MTTTYRRTNTDSALTGGLDFNKAILPAASDTTGSQVITLGNKEIHTSRAFTDVGIPGTAGVTGTYTVEQETITGNTSVDLSVQLHRINSAGTVQTSSTVSAEQTATAGTKTFTFTSLSLGTWATGDRLRVDYTYENTAHGGQEFTVTHGGTNNEVVAPWTIAESINIAPANLAVANVTSSPTVTQKHSIAPAGMVVANVTSNSSVAEPGALAVTNTTVTNTSGSSLTSYTFQHTVASGTDMLVIAVGSRTLATFTVTFNGVSMTSQVSAVSGTDIQVDLFTLAAPTVGTLDVVVSASVARRFTVFAYSVSGVTGVRASNGIADNGDTRYDISVNAQIGDLVIDSVHWVTSTRVLTFDAGQTGFDDQGVGGQDSRGGSSYIIADASPMPTGGSFGATDTRAQSSIALEPAAGSGNSIVPAGMVVTNATSSPTVAQSSDWTAYVEATTVADPGGSVSITPNNMVVASVTSDSSLTQKHSIAPANLAVANVTSSSTVTQKHSIAPNSAVSVTEISVPTLSQANELGSDDQVVVSAVTEPTLTQAHQSAPDSLAVASVASSPTATQAHQTAPAGLSVDATVSSPTVNQNHVTSPDDGVSATDISVPTLSQAGELGSDDHVAVTAVSDSSLTQAHSLAPDSLVVVSATSEPVLGIVASKLLLQSGYSLLKVDGFALLLSGSPIGAPNNSTIQSVVSDSALIQSHSLAPDSLVVSNVTSDSTLSQNHTIAPDSIAATTDISVPTLAQAGELGADDHVAVTTTSEPTVSQAHSIAPDSLTVTSVSSAPTLTEDYQLATDSSVAATHISEPALTQDHNVSVDSHASATDITVPTLSQSGELGVDDGIVVSAVSTPVLVQAHSVAVDSATVDSAVSSPSLSVVSYLTPNPLTVASATSAPTLSHDYHLSSASLVVTSQTSQPTTSVAGAMTPDSIVVNSITSGPVFGLSLSVFNLDVLNNTTSTSVFEPSVTTYGIGSPVASITVYEIEDYLYTEYLGITTTISSPTLAQSHVDLGNPNTLIVESRTTTPNVQPPIVIEVGVSPGYPRIDQDPALVRIDLDPTVTVIFDPITANTLRVDAQQALSVRIWTFSDNTVKLDDQPNEVRIDT